MVLTYNLNITSKYIMVLAITDSESHSTDPASINAARIAGVHQREQDTCHQPLGTFLTAATVAWRHWSSGRLESDQIQKNESCTVSPLSLPKVSVDC